MKNVIISKLIFSGVAFKDVPIVTPFGDSVLVRDLNFTIKSGEHLMITGPNGSGKTSILRILAGLWPLFCGQITRPNESLNSILYVPQRPYLSIGTLRDQIIYPHTKEEMEKNGVTDADLWPILKLVFLDYIPDREGGFDAKKEWKDVFSGISSFIIILRRRKTANSTCSTVLSQAKICNSR